MKSDLLENVLTLEQDRILYLFKLYEKRGSISPFELSILLSIIDSYKKAGGNSGAVDYVKTNIAALINMNVYTPNEYRLAMGINEIVNPLDTRMEVQRVFSFQDLDGHYEVTTSLVNQQQSRILDSQVQCDAATIERLRYETQCKNTCAMENGYGVSFNEAVQNISDTMCALYADNAPIYKFENTPKKKRYTIYDLDRLIFPEDPIREWTEKRVAEIEKKFEKWDDILKTM